MSIENPLLLVLNIEWCNLVICNGVLLKKLKCLHLTEDISVGERSYKSYYLVLLSEGCRRIEVDPV